MRPRGNKLALKSNKLSQLKHLKYVLDLGYYPSVGLEKVCGKKDRPAMLAVKSLADVAFRGESILMVSKISKIMDTHSDYFVALF